MEEPHFLNLWLRRNALHSNIYTQQLLEKFRSASQWINCSSQRNATVSWWQTAARLKTPQWQRGRAQCGGRRGESCRGRYRGLSQPRCRRAVAFAPKARAFRSTPSPFGRFFIPSRNWLWFPFGAFFDWLRERYIWKKLFIPVLISLGQVSFTPWYESDRHCLVHCVGCFRFCGHRRHKMRFLCIAEEFYGVSYVRAFFCLDLSGCHWEREELGKWDVGGILKPNLWHVVRTSLVECLMSVDLRTWHVKNNQHLHHVISYACAFLGVGVDWNWWSRKGGGRGSET